MRKVVKFVRNAARVLRDPRMLRSYASWGAHRPMVMPWGARIRQFKSFSEYWGYLGDIPSEAEQAFLRRCLAGGGVAVDVGANLGVVATLLAVSGASEVHAFEPVPSSYRGLVANTKPYPTIQTHQLALSNSAGWVPFTNNPAVSVQNRLMVGPSEDPWITVRTETLDDACERLGISSIAILKVDVEGAEQRVLEGATRLLSERAIGAMLIEIIPQALEEMGSSVASLEGLLHQYGYEIRVLAAQAGPREGYGRNFAVVPRDARPL